ncbi:hypothetical protein [Guptibacillus hwajinpoensis]|uniref:hypothetical protein n=1 Tax=Guptibacillus hwajinpoensis TaxID=208199 RepID=UPI003CFC1AAB
MRLFFENRKSTKSENAFIVIMLLNAIISGVGYFWDIQFASFNIFMLVVTASALIVVLMERKKRREER